MPDVALDDASRVPDGSVDGLAAPISHAAARPLADDAPRYVDQALLGQGGMGVVRVVHDRRLGRDVALKRPSAGDPGRAARLLHEAQVAATLEHPGIVPVYDLGVGPDGAPFYTMRIVRGRTLGEVVAATPEPRARLRLVRHVLDAARAVAYAHRRGVLHLDLKPHNVVIGELGETQVVDWGLAALTDGAGGAGGAADDGAGRGGGTPRYMSPEQHARAAVDARADVWGLGMLLGEALVGRPPEARRFEPRDLAALPPELGAIVRRALAPAPADRYPDARAFADDLERYLDARPVDAHAYSLAGHLVRLWRAWRGPLIVAAVALAVVVALTIVGVVRIVAERDRALGAEGQAVAASRQAERSLAAALTAQATLFARMDARPEAELAAARALALAPSPEALGVLSAFAAAPRPVLHTRTATPPCLRARLDPRGLDLLCLEAAGLSLWARDRDGEPLALRWRRDGAVADATLVPGAERVVATDPGDVVTHLDRRTGAPLPGPEPWHHARRLATSASGRRALAWENSYALVLDATAGGADARVPICSLANPAVALAADPDLATLVAACEDGTLEIVDPWTGARRAARMPFGASRPEASALALLPGGAEVAVATRRGTIAVVRLADGAIVREAALPAGSVKSFVAAPGDARVAVESAAGEVRLWDAASGAWLNALPAGSASHDLVFAPDGALWTVGAEVRRWTVAPEVLGHHQAAGVSALAASPDGARLAWGDRDAVVVVERTTGRLVQRREGVGRMVKSLVFMPDGALVAASVGAPVLTRLGPAADAVPEALDWATPCRRVGALAGGWLVVVPYSEELVVAAPGAGLAAARRLPLPRELRDASFRDDGAYAALVDAAGLVSILDVDVDARGGAPRLTPLGVAAGATALAVTADRTRVIAAVGQGGDLVALDAAGPRPLWSGPTKITELAVSADDRWIAAGDAAGRLVILDRTGAVRLALDAHADRLAGLAFVPGLPELATAGWDGRVRRLGLTVLDAPPQDQARALEAAWGPLVRRP